jgi:hypothetical protein
VRPISSDASTITTSTTGPRYADLLRALGQMLDAEGAETIEIADDETTITVTWIDRDGDERVRTVDKAGDVEAMRRDGRRRRGSATPRAEQSREELLRTLGQELDLTGAHLVHIREVHGFKVSVSEKDARRTDHWYSHDELLEKSRARRAHRSAEAQPDGAWWHFVRPA